MAPICADVASAQSGRGATNSAAAAQGAQHRAPAAPAAAAAGGANNSPAPSAPRSAPAHRASGDAAAPSTAGIRADSKAAPPGSTPSPTAPSPAAPRALRADSAASADPGQAAAAEDRGAKAEDVPRDTSSGPSGGDRPGQMAGGQSGPSPSVSRARRLRERRRSRLKKLTSSYVSDATEMFFLQQSKSVEQLDFPRDFASFRKKPPYRLLTFLKNRPGCPAQVMDEVKELVGPPSPSDTSETPSPAASASATGGNTTPLPPIAVGAAAALAAASASAHSTLAERLASPVAITPARSVFLSNVSEALSSLARQTSSSPQQPSPAAMRADSLPGLGRVLTAQHQQLQRFSSHLQQSPRIFGQQQQHPSPSPSLYSDAPWFGRNSERVSPKVREALADKMKAEAWVVRRVHELSKEGRWTPRRIPKVCERPRMRTHWDSLLQEMQWLSVDFYQERQWKVAAAKALAEEAKEFVERWGEVRRRRREAEERRKRRVAAFVAGEVRAFWDEVGRLSEAKRRLPEVPCADAPARPARHNLRRRRHSSSMAERLQQQQDDNQSDHSDKKPNIAPEKSAPEQTPNENGILDDRESSEGSEDEEDFDGEGRLSTDEEFTISEQERFEEDDAGGSHSATVLKELKDLAYDVTMPVADLLPDDYPKTLSEPRLPLEDEEAADKEVKEEGNGEHEDEVEEIKKVDEEGVEEIAAEEDGYRSDTSSIVDLQEMSLSALDELVYDFNPPASSRKAVERTVRVRMGPRQRRMYEDYLAAPAAQSALEKGELSAVARVVDQLRKICSHPRLAGETADDEFPLRSVSVPRVSDSSHFHPLFRRAAAYDPWRHFDLSSLNLVFLAHESALTAITSNCMSRLAAGAARLERLAEAADSSNGVSASQQQGQPWRPPRARVALEFTPVAAATPGGKNGYHVVGKAVPEDIVKKYKVSFQLEMRRFLTFHYSLRTIV